MSTYNIQPVIERLEELGWTQAQLEDHVGVVRGVASNWKHGRRTPNEENRAKLNTFLEDESLGQMFDKEQLDANVGKFPNLKRKPLGTRRPDTKVREISVVGRSPAVQAWTLQQAKGKCELCVEPAPFVRPDRRPYLEVHHVQRLAEGGEDVPDNTVALCPNCHRRAHYGKVKKVRRELERLVDRRTNR